MDSAAPRGVKPIWERDGDRGMVPGSTTKLLTAAAALLSLNPTDRLATRVVPGPSPDSVVLVGSGDPSLTALPDGQDGLYPEPARIADLLTVALLAALVAVQTLGVGDAIVVEARVPAVLVAAGLLLLRAPFLVVVVAAAAVAAALRWWGLAV